MARQDSQKENEPGSRSTQIILALIAAVSAILVGYWQFVTPKEKARPEAGSQRHFTGRVVDATDGSRLQGAKVSLEAQGVPPVLYTDSEGIFSFNLPNDVKYARLVIEAEGYKLYDRRVDAELTSGIQDIRLSPILSLGNTSGGVSTPAATSQLSAQLAKPVKEPRMATAEEDQTEVMAQLEPEITPPQLISKLEPHYPVAAQWARKSAIVDIRVLVGETGQILDIQRVSEPAGFGFDEAAIDAARRALYKPAMKDGKGVAMWYVLRVNFKPY